MTYKVNKQTGFTIIELMIATAVFSLVLLVTMAGILQITRMYYQGVTQTRTQETARLIIDEIGETIRFSNGNVTPATGTNPAGPEISPDINVPSVICIGSERYTYAIDRQLKESPSTLPADKQKQHVLWVDRPSSCDPATAADLNRSSLTDGRELLSENMRLADFSITPIGDPVNDLYRVSVSVVYGDNDLISTVDGRRVCEGATIGREFCAVSNLSVIVERRL